MNAVAFEWTQSSKEISETSRNHMEMLVDLLRDVNLEKRMETLIKAESFLKNDESDKGTLSSIRSELEEDLLLIRKMIFMVDQAQYFE